MRERSDGIGAGKMEGGNWTSTWLILPSLSSMTGTKTASSNGTKGEQLAVLWASSALILHLLMAPLLAASSSVSQSCREDPWTNDNSSGSRLPRRTSRTVPNLLTNASLSISISYGTLDDTRHCAHAVLPSLIAALTC